MNIPFIEIFVWLLGLCVGSFLNVVVYRLPLGLSISSPRWSFCPGCKSTLQWFENLPLVGWLLLRGRCRTCRIPIGLQYPLVEAIAGLVFVVVYRLLFVEQARASAGVLAIPADWAILLAWLILAAALIACSAMDIVSYMVDTGITNFAVLAGIVLLAFSPASPQTHTIAAHPLAAAACAAFVVSVFMLWWTLWRLPTGEESPIVDASPAPAEESVAGSLQVRPHTLLTGVTIIGGMVALAAWTSLEPVGAKSAPPLRDDVIDPVAIFSAAVARSGWAVPVSFLAIFLLMVLSAGQHREADTELHEAIEEEAPQARRTALREIAWLLPGVIAGGLTYALVALNPTASAFWTKLVGSSAATGVVFAIYGAVVAAAAGWIVRIFFTLAFGKEAFGVGDIYILAAAGACSGWDIALLGFLISVGVALLGFGIGLAMKRTSLIAFGPPLALGFLIALWLNRPAAIVAAAFWSDAQAIWERQPGLLSGLLGGSIVLALGLAKLTRWALERGSTEN